MTTRPQHAAPSVVVRHGRGPAGADHVLDELRRRVGPDRVRRFFCERSARVDVDDQGVRVVVPSAFMADALGRRFGSDLGAAASEVTGGRGVRFEVDAGAFGAESESQATAGRDASTPATQDRAAAPRRSGLRRGATQLRVDFSSFIVGASNRLAYSAATRVAQDPRHSGFSPLVLHGSCGVGKTLLLRCIVGEATKSQTPLRARYVTSEAFTNAYVSALRTGKVDDFRAEYRGLDLLCIDDVQFFCRKSHTQQELQHTLDAIGMTGAAVVLASDRHPRDIAGVAEGLRSRFLAGAAVEIGAPDRELMMELVRTFAARRGLIITEEAVALIAERAGKLGVAAGSPSARDIEGFLAQIDAIRTHASELCGPGGVVGLMLVRKALGLDGQHASSSRRRPITMEQIEARVCERLGIEGAELRGRGRHKRVVLGRALLTTLCRKLTTHSYPEIGRSIGRVNHSTVVTAHKRFEREVAGGKVVEVGLADDGLSYGELLDRLEAELGRAASERG